MSYDNFGALLWTVASAALPEGVFTRHWWWLVPIGSSLISSASTAGYLWAGHGFTRY